MPEPSRRITLAWLAALALLIPAGGCEGPGGQGGSWLRPRPGSDPEEDIWAVRCITVDGDQRIRRADQWADELKRVQGLKPDLVRVLHEDEGSIVYYGRYRRIYDERTGEERYQPDPRGDLDLIRQLSLVIDDPATGRRPVWPFQFATLETLPTARQVPADWRLENAPGHYSLQVAVFYNTENMRRRKYAAEEYCRLLREQGEEAYVHHGVRNSSVCIGAFPETALQVLEERDPLTGRMLVRQRIVDDRMLELQKKYRFNLENGHPVYEVVRDPRTGAPRRGEPNTSFPVLIPKEDAAATGFGTP